MEIRIGMGAGGAGRARGLLSAGAVCWLALAVLTGCQGMQAIREGRVYPRAVSRGPSLDIQVFRHTSRIELTNTTARSFGPSTLWLNGRFSSAIDGLLVGEHVEFRLAEFTDEFGESFRGGGFFAAEIPDRLVLAEIETSQEDGTPIILGLVVVGGQER